MLHTKVVETQGIVGDLQLLALDVWCPDLLMPCKFFYSAARSCNAPGAEEVGAMRGGGHAFGSCIARMDRVHEQMEAAVHLEVAATLAERALWVQVLKVVPRHKEALERLARLWLRVGRWQRALEVADRAAAAHAADFAAHALRGDVLMCARALPFPTFQHPFGLSVSLALWQLCSCRTCFLPCVYVLGEFACQFKSWTCVALYCARAERAEAPMCELKVTCL